MADESELGWEWVDEYMQPEIASDEENQAKLHNAQARARVKTKSEHEKQSMHYMSNRQMQAISDMKSITTENSVHKKLKVTKALALLIGIYKLCYTRPRYHLHPRECAKMHHFVVVIQ